MKENKAIYTTLEFTNWADRGGLIKAEKALFEKYLDPEKKTLEAGTAGGRILLELQRLGFSRLSGYDYVPEFIERAKERDKTGTIEYSVMDASALEYQDDEFDQVIYLQQIVSCIESGPARSAALREAYRVLKPKGIALISFCCLDVRASQRAYKSFLFWLRVLRMLRGRKVSIQYLPWLKHRERVNWRALLDEGPYVYWYKAREAAETLKQVGFTILAVGTDPQVVNNEMQSDVDALLNKELHNHMYLVCQKPYSLGAQD